MNKAKENTVDITIAIGIAVLCMYIFLTASGFPREAGLFPKIVSLITLVLALFQGLISARFHYRAKPNAEPKKSRSENNVTKKNFWITVVSLILYPILIFVIGYFPATFAYMGICMYCYGYRNKTGLVFITLGMVVFIYVTFVVFLRIKVPTGLLRGGI